MQIGFPGCPAILPRKRHVFLPLTDGTCQQALSLYTPLRYRYVQERVKIPGRYEPMGAEIPQQLRPLKGILQKAQRVFPKIALRATRLFRRKRPFGTGDEGVDGEHLKRLRNAGEIVGVQLPKCLTVHGILQALRPLTHMQNLCIAKRPILYPGQTAREGDIHQRCAAGKGTLPDIHQSIGQG